MLKKVRELDPGFVGRRINVQQHLVENDNGATFTYEVAAVSDAVAILPILPDGKIILVRNFRVPVDTMVLEAPAGKLEQGDMTPVAILDRAKAELEEECGYVADHWQPYGVTLSSPGITTERIYLFRAFGLHKTERKLEEAEQGMEVVTLTTKEVRQMLKDYQIHDSKTNVLLMRYFLDYANWPTAN